MAIEDYPRETKEYVHVVVSGDTDLTALPVKMAVLPYGVRPVEADWQAAEWDTDTDGSTIVKIRIGPGTTFDFSTSPGPKVPWVRVTTSQETPVLEGEPIRVT